MTMRNASCTPSGPSGCHEDDRVVVDHVRGDDLGQLVEVAAINRVEQPLHNPSRSGRRSIRLSRWSHSCTCSASSFMVTILSSAGSGSLALTLPATGGGGGGRVGSVVDRARRGASGALYPKSTYGGLNPRPRVRRPRRSARTERRWPGPAQRDPVNRVRSGRKQLSAGTAVCRRRAWPEPAAVQALRDAGFDGGCTVHPFRPRRESGGWGSLGPLWPTSPVPQAPPPDLRRARRPGGRERGAAQRRPRRPGRPRLSCSRDQGDGQDHDGPAAGQGAQLRRPGPTPANRATSATPASQITDGTIHGRHRARRRLQPGRWTSRATCSSGSPTLRPRGPQGLHHRRGPHAHQGGVDGAAQDAGGAARPRAVHRLATTDPQKVLDDHPVPRQHFEFSPHPHRPPWSRHLAGSARPRRSTSSRPRSSWWPGGRRLPPRRASPGSTRC